MSLLARLIEEKDMALKGGLYHTVQVRFAYNTNRIEGSRLSEEQTRYIFETNTLMLPEGEQTANIDDILEAVNHFACFDLLLDMAADPLTEEQIKTFHRLLKSNTSDAKKSWFSVGDYKKLPNMVGGIETTHPDQVALAMAGLLERYDAIHHHDFEDIVDFHYQFERIHPFQDGNGRVGRLIMFKECLRLGIVPFIIEDDHKFFYYRGLNEYSRVRGFLMDTCLSAQDNFKKLMAYFGPGKD